MLTLIGKSTVIKEIFLQCLKNNEKVLVTAYSNAGCDNLSSIINLLECDINYTQFKKDSFLRIGNAARINEKSKIITLEERENRFFYKWCLNQIEKTIYCTEDKPLISEREGDLNSKLNVLREIFIEKSQVIFSTCISSGSFIMRKYMSNRKTFFDVVIIDEASQALEASCWIPILLGKKVIIVGDFNQIGPIVNTNNLKIIPTLFERIYFQYRDKISRMICVQFRMHKKIMEFPSKYFYKGKLIADESMAEKTIDSKFKMNAKLMKQTYNPDSQNLFKEPLILIDTGGEFKENKLATTKYNEGEAKIVEWFVGYLIKHGIKPKDIGIITPYTGQVSYLRDALDKNIDISTVDAFQGSEREIIIISFVRSNDHKKIGFLADKKRINVALTRPKKMLILICDTSTLNCNNFLNEMVNFYKNNSLILYSDIIYSKY